MLRSMIINKRDTTINFKYIITIKVTPNNIFINLSDLAQDKTILNFSAGNFKINISKKNLKFNAKLIIQKALRGFENLFKNNKSIIKLSAPIRIRKQILKIITLYFNKEDLILKLRYLKPFNGCRSPKKIRKKRKKIRIFKNV